MDARQGARLLAAIRIGVGASGLLTPRLFARAWLGPEATHPSIAPAVRGLAARDAALGLGLLFALRRGTPVRGWLEAGALADSADSMATLLGHPDMPGGRRLFFSVSGAGVAAIGIRLARKLS